MEKVIERLWFPSLISLSAALLMLGLRGLILRRHKKKSGQTNAQNGYAVVLHAFRTPSFYWCLVFGIYVGLEVSELPNRYTVIAKQAMEVLVLVSFTLAAANLLVALFKNFVHTVEGPVQTSGLVVGVIRVGTLATGTLLILSVMGISITPLLTALGVGGLAVALALKDTLENLFSGIYLLTDRTIRVGDYIRLEQGAEGHVEDIGWRTTRVRLATSTTLIVPNSKLAQSNLTNYYLPDRRINVLLPVVVQNEADPLVVEEVLYQIMKESTEDVADLLSHPAPVVRLLSAFQAGVLEFQVSFHVQSVEGQGFVSSELRKRFVKALRARGIQLPAIKPSI